MSDQYTSSIESAQAYLTALQRETITRQEQEIHQLKQDLSKARSTMSLLIAQVRDLETDLAMAQPRQLQEDPLISTKTQRVKQLAALHGVSEATAWRKVKDGTWTAA